MATETKTFHGARALLYIGHAGKTQLSGVFHNCSYTVTYDVAPAYILGKFQPGELVYTAQEPVQVQCGAFRVVGNGPHGTMGVPKVQDLLNAEEVTVTIVDRVTDKILMTVTGCRPTGHSANFQSRSLTDLSVQMMGIGYGDESGRNEEPAGSPIFGQ